MLLQDAEGNLQAGAQVRILQPNSNNPITAPMYGSDEGNDLIPNPFITEVGVISIYIDEPMRVRIAFQVEGASEQYIEDIDIGGAGGDSSEHPGLGDDSMRIGVNAGASGDKSTSAGVNANASGNNSVAMGADSYAVQNGAVAIGQHAQGGADQSVAVGRESSVHATGTVALGYQAEATQNFGMALGTDSVATSTRGVAIGHSASATHENSIAIGNSASTNDSNQIMLGNSNHTTFIPGVMMLQSPGGSQVEIRISEEGVMYSTWNVSSGEENFIPVGDSQFSDGVGSWVGDGSSVSVTNDSDVSPSPVLTMDDASDQNEMYPDAISAVEGNRYIAQVWIRSSGTFKANVYVSFLDDSDNVISSSLPLEVPESPNQWVRASSRGVAPAGAESAQLRVVSSGGSSSDKIYILYAGLYDVS